MIYHSASMRSLVLVGLQPWEVPFEHSVAGLWGFLPPRCHWEAVFFVGVETFFID